MPRVMLIDDDDAVRASIRKLLEREGHTVIEEADGKSALRHFAGNPADVVISDVFMPDMSGIEFLIRVREVFPEAKIIVISGGGYLTKESALSNAAIFGADRILEKPVEAEVLMKTVREVLESR